MSCSTQSVRSTTTTSQHFSSVVVIMSRSVTLALVLLAVLNVHPGNRLCGLYLRGAALGSVWDSCLQLSPDLLWMIRADLRSEQRLLLRIPGKVIREVSSSRHGDKVHAGVRGRIIKWRKHSGGEARVKSYDNTVWTCRLFLLLTQISVWYQRGWSREGERSASWLHEKF